MTKRAVSGEDRKLIARYPKIADAAMARIAYYFCHGASVDAVAKTVGVSRKTVRELYIAMRAQLPGPRFARWHRANRALLNVASENTDLLIRATFFDVLAECGLNTTCQRNFEAGNRKVRLCRSCTLPGKFTASERVEEALALIDAVRAFYRRVGIHGEAEKDVVSLFRQRLIHTVVVTTAMANGRKLKSGLLDPAHRTELSFGSLLKTLLEYLAANEEMQFGIV